MSDEVNYQIDQLQGEVRSLEIDVRYLKEDIAKVESENAALRTIIGKFQERFKEFDEVFRAHMRNHK